MSIWLIKITISTRKYANQKKKKYFFLLKFMISNLLLVYFPHIWHPNALKVFSTWNITRITKSFPETISSVVEVLNCFNYRMSLWLLLPLMSLLLLPQFEFLRFVTILLIKVCHNLSFEFCHNLIFLVLSQFEFLNFVTI